MLTAAECAAAALLQLFPALGLSRAHSSDVHLCHYGASFYSYLMCRVYASAAWSRFFQRDPLSRQAGQTLFDCLLRHGGAREPQRALQSEQTHRSHSSASLSTALPGRPLTRALLLSSVSAVLSCLFGSDLEAPIREFVAMRGLTQ
jgi:hypothetical protein